MQESIDMTSSDWIVVVFLGDSLTAGYQQGPGYLPPRYYPFTNMLESRLRVKLRELGVNKDLVVVNQGIDGDSTRGMLDRFHRGVESENPDIVLIWGGINDLSTRIPPESVLHNIIQLVERTREINALPVVLNNAPVSGTHFNETIKSLNKLIQEYCTKQNVEYVDLFSELVDREGRLAEEYSNDGIHLSDLAYRKISVSLFHTIMRDIGISVN
jgi:lysophospholipase L1-like esterase